MRRLSAIAATGVLVAAAAGCYHATINTGLTPSTTVVDKPWASGWAWGLVAPSPVETMAGCPSGVARVETEHSFVNMLVGGLTFGIYSPMHIKVTCAQARADAGFLRVELAANPTAAEIGAAVARAVAVANSTGAAVFVIY